MENKARLNAPSTEETLVFINGYLSALTDARAQLLLARTKELKHEALDFVDAKLKEFEELVLS